MGVLRWAIAADQSVFAIIEQVKYVDRFELAKLDPNGMLEWNRTIGDHTWPWPSHGYAVPIEVGSNGFLYISYMKSNGGEGPSFGLDAYQYTSIYSNQSVSDQYIFTIFSQAVTIGSLAVIVVFLILIVRHKRKPPSSSLG